MALAVVASVLYASRLASMCFRNLRRRPTPSLSGRASVGETNAVPLGERKKKMERYVERLGRDAFSEVRPAGDSSARRPWE